MSSNHEDGRPQGLPLALDPIAKSASTTELAFIAKPAGTLQYHGFLLSMYGRRRELHANLGGGEAWLKQERESFYGEKAKSKWNCELLEGNLADLPEATQSASS